MTCWSDCQRIRPTALASCCHTSGNRAADWSPTTAPLRQGGAPIRLLLFVRVREGSRTAATRFTPPFTPQGPRTENGLAPCSANPLIFLAEWTGLEPATPGVTGTYTANWGERRRTRIRLK